MTSIKLKNRFDQELIFRFAKFNELDKIQSFYKNYWDNKNLITEDKNFTLYEFGNNLNLNFFLSENKQSHYIESIIGFYKYSNEENLIHICSSMTLVNPNSNYPLLGIETTKRLKIISRCNSFCGTNTNPKTMLPLVKKYLSHKTGKMNHYFILNKKIKDYKISIPDIEDLKKKSNSTKIFQFNSIKNLKDLVKTKIFYKKYDNLPYKSLDYFIKRYLYHPIYKYDIYAIKDKNIFDSIIVLRKVNHLNTSVLRVIDFIGNLQTISKIGSNLIELINKYNCEYVDIFCNLPEKFFIDSPFINKSKSNSIIPHYFEPFVRENIEIFYESSKEYLYFFKGDADGDRPNKKLF